MVIVSATARTVACMADGAGKDTVRPETSSAVVRVSSDQAAPETTGQYTEEDIDRALWEIALHGGNVTRAFNSLADQGFVGYVRRTMSYWKNGPYRNRYTELMSGRARDFEEHLAQRSLEIAAKQQQVEMDAMDQIAGRMGALDAVEASTVVRNISGARAQNVDKALALRGRHPTQVAGRGLEAIGAALARLGVAQMVEGEAQEIEDAEVA
jgi:hypothetical protein